MAASKPVAGVRRELTRVRQRPAVEPAPGCLPDARTPVTVYFRGVNRGFICRVVRIDPRAQQVLVALPDTTRGIPVPRSKSPSVMGWADHASWHESRTTASFKDGSRYCWLRVTGGTVHRERRRHVRAKHRRPISVHSGRHSVSGTTLDISEAALRLVTGLHEPIYTGNKVHMVFKTPHRYRGEAVPIAIDGQVHRIRELEGSDAGRKEVVIFYDSLRAAEEDFIRGIVFDIHLQENRPTAQV